jgi:hypothetical protein
MSFALLVGGLVTAGPALADHHLVLVNEVFPGTVAAPGVEAVEIKAYSIGQNSLAGHEIRTYDAAGTQLDSFAFPSNSSNSASQASYVAMTPAAEAYFGIQADLEMDAETMSPAGGKACFVSDSDGVIDCVAWGNYSAGAGTGTSAVGDPVSPTGITDGQSIIRDDGGNGLQESDDTDDSADDFSEGTPTPKNSGNIVGNAAGRIGFRYTSYSAKEGVGMGQVSITRAGTGLEASVTVDTSDGTATDPNDYTDSSQVLTFAAGDAEEIFSFPIVDDSLEEAAETVTVTLSAPTNGAVLRPTTVKPFTIRANDGPSVFRFDKRSYARREGRRVIITIIRSGNTDIDASVTFRMRNGTAESNDYRGGPFRMRFTFQGDPNGPDQTTMQIVQRLNQDRRNERNETIKLALLNPSANAELGSPNRATITIRDDD